MIKSYNLNHFIQQCSNDIDLIQLRLWNAAFDAGYASALNKSIIVIHSDDHQHALKELDAAASAVASDQLQVVRILKYVLEGSL